jgi:hypothetical protein
MKRDQQMQILRRLGWALLTVPWLMISGATSAPAQTADIEALERRYDELYAGGDIAGALTQAQRIEAAVKKRVGPNHHDYAVVLERLAAVYARQGRNGEAEAAFRRALPILEKAPVRTKPTSHPPWPIFRSSTERSVVPGRPSL